MEEDLFKELFHFTRDVIYGDIRSISMAEACAVKWKIMKKKHFIQLPPDEDSLRQHCLRVNYLVRHHSLKNHPSPLGHGWELVNGRCRPVRHVRLLPINIPAPGQADEEDENESQNDREYESLESDNSEYSLAESSDISFIYILIEFRNFIEYC